MVYDVDQNASNEFSQGKNFELRSDKYGYFEAVVWGPRRPRKATQAGRRDRAQLRMTEEEGGKATTHDRFASWGFWAHRHPQ